MFDLQPCHAARAGQQARQFFWRVRIDANDVALRGAPRREVRTEFCTTQHMILVLNTHIHPLFEHHVMQDFENRMKAGAHCKGGARWSMCLPLDAATRGLAHKIKS